MPRDTRPEEPDTEKNPYVRPEVEDDLDFDDPDSLSEEEARRQVELLREAVKYHDYRYYVENDPVVSDAFYDRLFRRLEILEDEFGFEDENSPTRRVGGELLESLETREHTTEMLSLNSSESEHDVREFDRRVREATDEDVMYTGEPKFDGFSIEIVYVDGEFDRAVTRGDGVEGEDVTENVRTVRSVPLSLIGDEAPSQLSVRGEIYMPVSGFHEINEERIQKGEKPFANPRNAAAGTVRQLDPGVVADRPLDVFFYDILDTSAEVGSQQEAFELIKSLGLRVTELNRVFEDIADFIDYREELLERRDELDFEIDGVVVKVDDYDVRDELGETSRHPRWAFAYKFPPKTDETTVRSIVVQVGRTGKLTPVALLDPVDVGGVTVSRATLHNEGQVRRLSVNEGARVRIQRAGDVIPEITEVIESDGEEEFRMPDECPVCGSDVMVEGEHHYCTGGAVCEAQLKRSIEHFCSRDAMDIEGVGEEVADVLVDEGLLESVADLYELETSEVARLPGFGEKSAQKLVGEIEASKDTTTSRFVLGLGIRHVGERRARSLAREFTVNELMGASTDELLEIDDVGTEVAESIVEFFDNPENVRTVNRMLEAGIEPEDETGGEGDESIDALEGLTFVFTGSIEGYTRSELTKKLEKGGAKVTPSVSGNTDYLVVGENPGETKVNDAEEEGVTVVEAEEFKDKFLSELEM